MRLTIHSLYPVLALAIVFLVSCKREPVNTQLKNSAWELNNEIHRSDDVQQTGDRLTGLESKNGKVSQVTAQFYGGVPGVGGKFQIVQNPTRYGQVRLSTFVNNNTDTLWVSSNNNLDSAVVKFQGSQVNIFANNVNMVVTIDSTRKGVLQLNLLRRY